MFYNLTMLTIASFGPTCVMLLNLTASLYLTHPIPSLAWTLVFGFWIYIVCTVIYGNLTAFIVVAKYLHIKQKSITVSLKGILFS